MRSARLLAHLSLQRSPSARQGVPPAEPRGSLDGGCSHPQLRAHELSLGGPTEREQSAWVLQAPLPATHTASCPGPGASAPLEPSTSPGLATVAPRLGRPARLGGFPLFYGSILAAQARRRRCQRQRVCPTVYPGGCPERWPGTPGAIWGSSLRASGSGPPGSLASASMQCRV